VLNVSTLVPEWGQDPTYRRCRRGYSSWPGRVFV